MTSREKLAALAANLWWSWNPEALDLFRRLNPETFRSTGHAPLAALASADDAVLQDVAFSKDVDAAYAAFERYMSASFPYEDAPRTSYFCMEFGLHESLPLYAGGLGVLAGDHTKATSDLGLPFTAIGLYLKDGYFKQHFDESGWQLAQYPSLEPGHHPLFLVKDDAGKTVTVTVHLGFQPLKLQAWRLDVGRTPLYLLDADVAGNPPLLRTLTHKLYQGDRKMRLQQEIILGIGGLRLLRALGVESDVYHLNEGHSVFATLELLRERLAAGDLHPDAEMHVRERCVFTTHTPVPAGHDRFVPALFNEQMAGFREQIGLGEKELLAFGRVNPYDDGESFTMTVLGLRMARKTNGVSALNGEVARRQWHHLYPERPLDHVPIGSITNGVHLPTWTAPPAHGFLREHLGADWKLHRHQPDLWKALADVPDEELWAFRSQMRRRLIEFVYARAPRQSLPQHLDLDPEALTIGFARRFATYKRAPLLLSDLDRISRLFADADRPLQVIYAGKAHPADEGGKRYIQQIIQAGRYADLKGKVIFLENYDMEIGRMLTSGCDVWLNNPRRPLEASGTSGQKIAAHAGMNLSVLDGWWPEGYNGQNGWPIGPAATGLNEDPAVQDPQDALALYEMLEKEVVPTFYDRDAAGLPRTWIARMRNAMQTLPARFSAARMVIDYIEQMYRVTTPTEA